MSDLAASRRGADKKGFDLPDQILFFGFFLVGGAAIWVLKLQHVHQTIVTAVPIALMALYALLAFVTKRYRLREDKVGDNIYYLGFLFTLVSLSYALYVYDPDGSGASDIINNFGIAIFTTIIGLAGRVCFNQMREDPIEYEREARYSLAEATRDLRSNLADITIEMASFKRKMLQITEEGAIDISNSARVALTENIERFSNASNEVADKIRAAFATFTDQATLLNETSSKNVEALQNLFDRIEHIEAEPGLISDKLDPVIASFADVANETARRNRAQTNDLKRIQSSVDAIVEAADEFKEMIAAASRGQSNSWEKLGAVVDAATGKIAGFENAMAGASGELRAEIEACRTAASTLGEGVAAQQASVASIRASIEAELKVAQQHRSEIATLQAESRAAVSEVEKSLVSLSKTLVEQLGG
jgi:hypothetical protein